MSRLTEFDWERIEEFANTPGYKREPEMLLPDDDGAANDSLVRRD